jgi:hypothetical protein
MAQSEAVEHLLARRRKVLDKISHIVNNHISPAPASTQDVAKPGDCKSKLLI